MAVLSTGSALLFCAVWCCVSAASKGGEGRFLSRKVHNRLSSLTKRSVKGELRGGERWAFGWRKLTFFNVKCNAHIVSKLQVNAKNVRLSRFFMSFRSAVTCPMAIFPLSLSCPQVWDHLSAVSVWGWPVVGWAYHRVAATTSFSPNGPLEPDGRPYRRYILVKLWTNAHWGWWFTQSLFFP